MSTKDGQNSGDAKTRRAGQTLQEARLAAHIEVNKICADLRISPNALEAIEQGNYNQLSGDPYIRALIGTMSRYLGLDPAAVVKEYNQEVGAASQAQIIAPYTDKASTFSTRHKQIFLVIVFALILVLFLLIGRLNRGGDIPSVPAGNLPTPAESLAMPGDSAPESRFLAPDTTSGADTLKDSAGVRPTPQGTLPVPIPGATTPAPGAPGSVQPGAATPTPGSKPAAADTAGMTVAVIKPNVDSVGVRIVRSGQEEFATLLRLGKQIQISHPDTILVFTSRRGSVEVTVGGRTVTPDRKRFKIYGPTVKAF